MTKDDDYASAIKLYEQKFGKKPTHLWVHPTKELPEIVGLKVGQYPTGSTLTIIVGED